MQAVQSGLHVFVFLFKCFHHGQSKESKNKRSQAFTWHSARCKKKKKKSILWKLVMAKEVSNLIMEEFTGTCICQFDWTSLCW